MALDKNKILDMAKARGIDIGEEVAEKLAKLGAHLLLDLLEEMAKQTDTPVDDMIVAAAMGPARKMADEIDVTL